MIGISLRFALAVGLHLRNDDPSASPSRKESLVRIWWGLHSIEGLICTIIGRPCVIPSDQCTVPLPSVAPGRQPSYKNPAESINPMHWRRLNITSSRSDSSGRGNSNTVARTSFLGACVTMGLIVQKALSRLYSPRTAVDSWEQVQMQIDSLSNELDEWVAAALPALLKPANSIQEPGVQREQLLLSFQYHSAKLLIYRPCLCRIERHIVGQTNASAEFNQKTAEACVEAAQAVTRLLPDEPDQTFIYQQSPWWSIVHNIMQAMAVFLLELSFRQTHMAHPDERILKGIKKLVQWLHFMKARNAVARRAYEMIADLVRTSAPRLQINVADILIEEPMGIDQEESFQTNQPPRGNTTSLGYEGVPSLQPDCELPSSTAYTAPADFSTNYPTSLWEQQPPQTFEAFQPHPYFMPEPDLHMPSVFGNPFLTSFDLPNPLDGQFFFDGDCAIDNS